MSPEYTTLTRVGTLYGADGYVEKTGIAAAKHIERDGNTVYSVGRSSYPAEELTITDTSLAHVNGWAVKW